MLIGNNKLVLIDEAQRVAAIGLTVKLLTDAAREVQDPVPWLSPGVHFVGNTMIDTLELLLPRRRHCHRAAPVNVTLA